jgi:hypothetical protein
VPDVTAAGVIVKVKVAFGRLPPFSLSNFLVNVSDVIGSVFSVFVPLVPVPPDESVEPLSELSFPLAGVVVSLANAGITLMLNTVAVANIAAKNFLILFMSLPPLFFVFLFFFFVCNVFKSD